MMKQIVIFKGGLGNQLSQYGMYTYRKHILGKDVRWLYRESAHNGMEINKYFDVHMQQAHPIYHLLFWVVWRLYKYNIYKKLIFNENDNEEPQNAIFINGYWGYKKYISHEGFNIAFRDLPLSERNKEIADMLTSCDSIAVHVRRGDYLLPQNAKIFTTLDKDYYTQAIDLCQKKLNPNHPPRVFFFSNDIDWVKENLPYDNAVYIDWNTKDNSIYDMYLMSQASANVIANSSFSFWAAFLNKRQKIVVYPKNWYSNGRKNRDIFPIEWIKI